MIELELVLPDQDWMVQTLYELLAARAGATSINISHDGALPSYEQHAEFVRNHPYEAWYLIGDDGVARGSIYLTKAPRQSIAGNEIGVFIFPHSQRQGYAKAAIKLLMAKHGPGNYYANINPKNTPSTAMFQKLGFDLVQMTYRFTHES